MLKRVEIFRKPLEIKKVLSMDKAEMSHLQQAMLCGLIKEHKPKKIVEVGVAAGGTTAVILNCISMLEMDTEVYSVDILENYYRDKSKMTGYLAEECKTFLDREVHHTTYLGRCLPEILDDIGEGIDFLILDTIHRLPGEILDFLVALPWMKDNAIVVLHDIFLNHYEDVRNINSYATRVLLSAVVGEKIIGNGNDGFCDYIGLGAFKVTLDTRKYIENVFSALMITWQSMPELSQIEVYRKWFEKNYEDDLLREFDAAVELNRTTLLRKEESNIQLNGLCSIVELAEELKNKENIYIYGCGVYGKKIYSFLKCFDIKVKGFVVSDNQVKPYSNETVEFISDLNIKSCMLVVAMSIWNQKEVCKELKSDHYICINEKIIDFLKL